MNGIVRQKVNKEERNQNMKEKKYTKVIKKECMELEKRESG